MSGEGEGEGEGSSLRVDRLGRTAHAILHCDALGEGHAQRPSLLLGQRAARCVGVDDGALHELGHLNRLRLRAVLCLKDAAHTVAAITGHPGEQRTDGRAEATVELATWLGLGLGLG